MIKKYFKYYLFLLPVIVVCLAGCNKYLDTTSPTSIDQNVLFSSQQGFSEAMNGVYLEMGSSALYGRELTMGLISVLGRSYDTTILPSIGDLYYEGARYNFQNPSVFATIKNVWDSTYQCIAGLNNILAQADVHQNVFSGNGYVNTKAEALALRAFLHFDLLRMFGPANAAQNLNVVAIPYVKIVGPNAIPYSTTGAILDSCLADLSLAQSLIADSSKITARINYWGMKALKAKIYLYKGDLANAQLNALQLINNKQYNLVTTNTDILFSGEHVFSIYVYLPNINNYLKTLFSTTTPLGLLPVNQTALYITGSGSALDWRKSTAFIDPATNATTNATNPNAVIVPKKLSTVSNGVGTSCTMPMIRLSEIYYIAAECAQLKDNDLVKATAFLDTIRVHRNVPVYTLASLPTDSISAELRKEYMKEFIGEGQAFYYFKRKNINIANLPFTKVPAISNATYVFPKPE